MTAPSRLRRSQFRVPPFTWSAAPPSGQASTVCRRLHAGPLAAHRSCLMAMLGSGCKRDLRDSDRAVTNHHSAGPFCHSDAYQQPTASGEWYTQRIGHPFALPIGHGSRADLDRHRGSLQEKGTSESSRSLLCSAEFSSMAQVAPGGLRKSLRGITGA